MKHPEGYDLTQVFYSEAMFRELFQHMSSCVAVYAPVNDGEDFIFLDFNHAAELLDNVRREEIVGKRLSECFPGVGEFGFMAVLRRVLGSGQPEHFPARLYRDNRIEGWRENYVYRLPSGEVVAIYDDVTESKRAEADLRESHEKLDSLLNSMAEGAYGVDTNGICTFVNQSFLDILGYGSPDEVIGKHIHELIHHSYADGSPYPASECRMYAVYRRGLDMHVSDEVFWRKDGKAIPVEYWSKPIARDGAIVGAVATFLDISERKKAEEEIHKLAFYDPLTHLPNRRLLDDRMRQAFAACHRSGNLGALLYIDLDNFKPLNDKHGHAVGDLLLAEVGRRITACMRAVDTVARIGGDEFVILACDLTQSRSDAAKLAAAIAEKIRSALALPYLLHPLKDENAAALIEHCCTSSIGVALFSSRDSNRDTLLKHADTAMYRAKDAGRNQFRFYEL